MHVFIFLVKFRYLSGHVHLLGKLLPIPLTICFYGISLVFSHLGFWSGNLFLVAPFPDLCSILSTC